ncbi:glycosyltransferase [Nostoc linckia z18]|uniref:Glycosyltransferase n=2 Tax=Nostoc linckia TaxID=92942 RepID=A0A9Q6ELF6_NOSLI|nr:MULTISPECIES: glycosyltransferase [Nostoc]PHK41996.1 glycosyltransferase [Nostoc linckia z15]PHK45621.1 glycosyltransferase [Nostoc linckia z16]MBC1238442.1 glycosyltransferase [Nostoc sp. 2RC]PHJ59375.1 glycosyltransferase [Nostoc linckia z1]PHJ62072.1 glycosyltransferase [Nostoc linckia z3]
MNYQPIDATTATSFLPMVSVVIPIYNGEADLPDLLNCLLSQTYPKHRVEYLLVDNNSSDGTFNLLKTTAANSPITIRPLSENQIQSSYAARNTGIRGAIGEIIVFTDADCRPQPQWLNALILPFVNLEVVIVAGEILALPGKTLLEQHADREETLSQKHTLGHAFRPYGQTANLAIRRIAFEKAGLFRPHLTTGGDADICWRILAENIGGLEFAPNAIVQHRHRTTLLELQSQWRRYGRSNRYLHELYGIDLMRDITLSECGYRLARWLLKEVPRDIRGAIAGKATLVDLLNTPIGLFTARARTAGQREAKLPEKAKIVARL